MLCLDDFDIGVDNISNVEKISSGFEVAHHDVRVVAGEHFPGDLTCEVGNDKSRFLSGTEVVRQPEMDKLSPLFFSQHSHRFSGRILAECIGICRGAYRIFRQGEGR